MKEKDLDKNLDNIIIDGLIKEAEQDNADFAAAIRKMSDEEFMDMVYEPAYADMEKSVAAEPALYRKVSASESADDVALETKPMPAVHKKSKFKILRPWITAAVSAAAVVLLILIPSFNAMNAKLCDSALYMSEAYITPAKGGFDISSASETQIKEELPNLKQRYESSIIVDGSTTTYTDDFQDAGWTLAIAYLKLHKKNDAVKVLKTLESQSKGTPFGGHCSKMLEQLD